MRFTATPIFLACLAAAAPFDGFEDAASIEARVGPPIDPHLFIVGTPYTSGTGCPKGTATVEIDLPQQLMTVNFDAFQVETGPAPLTAKKSAQSCKLTINMKYDAGWTLSVFQTKFNGYASLSKGVNGRIIGTAAFTGGEGKPRWDLNLKGPYVDSFTLEGDSLLKARGPSCRPGLNSATLNIDITMLLDPVAPTRDPQPGSSDVLKGTMGGSDLQGSLAQIWHFRPERCPGNW